ncbi:MAG: HEAT repeat domain-containing protein [Myxococcota bacterium]
MLGVLGCGEAEPRRPLATPASSEAGSAAHTGLAEGEHRIEITHDFVRIEANRAPLGAVLDEIAVRMGVALEADAASRRTPVAVAVDAPDLPRALPSLLRGSDFRASFAPTDGDAVRLVALTVGALPGRAAADRSPRPAARAPAGQAARSHGFDDDAPDRDDDEAETLSQEEALATLERGSRDERVAAIRAIEPEGAGLRALIDVLRDDGDPAVRAAAAEQLEDARGFAGVQALLAALADREVVVVRAAIESLEFAGDESVIAQLEPLLDHPDPDVRHDAEDAIEFLRD